MTMALSIIREEHRSLSAVTRTLKLLARDARGGGREPDWELFTLILDYIEGFSDRFHHPKEDHHLFTAVRRRTREADEALDVLERDHARGDELLRELRYLLSRCRWPSGGSPPPIGSRSTPPSVKTRIPSSAPGPGRGVQAAVRAHPQPRAGTDRGGSGEAGDLAK
jgi:hypothetical protein